MPLLSDSAIQVQGFSWIMHDIWQFMKVSVNPHHYLSSKIFTHTYTHTKHYYHWWGEIILGGWRVYSLVGFDSDGTFHSEWLQSPDRFLIPVRIFIWLCDSDKMPYTDFYTLDGG